MNPLYFGYLETKSALILGTIIEKMCIFTLKCESVLIYKEFVIETLCYVTTKLSIIMVQYEYIEMYCQQVCKLKPNSLIYVA